MSKMSKVDEFLSSAMAAYDDVMAERDDDDYVVDYEQMAKLMRAVKFFERIVKESGGRIDMPQITPKKEVGGMTVYMTLLYLTDQQVAEFSEVVADMSAISIDATADGDVCISFNIGLFKHK